MRRGWQVAVEVVGHVMGWWLMGWWRCSWLDQAHLEALENGRSTRKLPLCPERAVAAQRLGAAQWHRHAALQCYLVQCGLRGIMQATLAGCATAWQLVWHAGW
jgi:hypothetical protein